MALKISYSRLVWEDIKRRNWLGICIVLGLLFVMPVKLTMNLEEKIHWMNEPGSIYTREQLLQYFDTVLGFQNRYVITAVILCAVACGITGFAYLHAKEKIDFYHSFPFRRERWFLITYISGALLFFVPYLVSGLLMYLVGFMRGLVVNGAVIQFLSVAGYHTLFFLVIYSITILSMMLTGQIIVGILGAGVIFGYGPLLVRVWNVLCMQFFNTFLSEEYMSQALQTSPLGIYYYGAAQMDQGTIPYHTLIIIGIILVLAVGGAILLYRIRPMDAAGHAMAFPKLEGGVKVFISVPAALGVGSLFIYSALREQKWIIIASMVAVVLVCIVIEFIFQLDIRQIVQHKTATVIAVVTVAGILCVMKFDLAGYNTYLPGKEQIESMAIFSSGYRSYFSYSDLVYSEKSFLERAETRQFQDIYKLAECGAQNGNTEWGKAEQEYVSVLFRLKSGKKVYRGYEVEPELVETAARKLFQSDSYKKGILPINYLEADKIKDIYFRDITQQQRRLSLTKEEQSALFRVFQEECENLTFEQMAYEQPIAVMDTEIAIEYKDQFISSSTQGRFYIYAGFRKILAMLKAYGYIPEKAINPEQIEKMYIVENTGIVEEKEEVKNPEERDQILSSIGFGCSGLLNQSLEYGKLILIEWKSGSKESYYYFLKGKAPDFV